MANESLLQVYSEEMPSPNTQPRGLTIDERVKLAQLEKLQAETKMLAAPWWKSLETWSKVMIATLGVGGAAFALYLEIPKRLNELAKVEGDLNDKNRKLQQALADTTKVIAEKEAAIEMRKEAEVLRNRIASEYQVLQEQVADLRGKVAPAQNATLEVAARPRVFVQFAGEISREMINDFRRALESANYGAPQAERIAGPSRTEARYFETGAVASDEAQKKQAEDVLRVTRDFFASQGCPLGESRVQKIARSTQAPLEVWINHNCKSG